LGNNDPQTKAGVESKIADDDFITDYRFHHVFELRMKTAERSATLPYIS
jgi:hypothetical protein